MAKTTQVSNAALRSAGKKQHHSQVLAVRSLPVGSAQASSGLQSPEGGLKWMGYFLSLLPFYGLLLGIVYLPQPSPKAKHFGKICLILAGLGIFLWVMGWGLSMAAKWVFGLPDAGFQSGYF